MAFTDKLMFWKKEDSLPPLDSGNHSAPPMGELPPLGGSNIPGMPGSDSMSGFPSPSTDQNAPAPPGFGGLSAPPPGMPGSDASAGGIERDLRIQPTSPLQPNPHPSSYAPIQPVGNSGQNPIQNQNSADEAHAKNILAKELEIISTKLDFLKASLENINQRLSNLEQQGGNRRDQW